MIQMSLIKLLVMQWDKFILQMSNADSVLGKIHLRMGKDATFAYRNLKNQNESMIQIYTLQHTISHHVGASGL